MALLPSLVKLHRCQLSLARRNGKRILCLLLSTCLVGAILPFISSSNSDAANLAFAQARSSPVAIRALGQPLLRSYFAFGEVETHGSKGEASVALTVYGPRGRGTLYADAVRANGSWQLTSLDLALPGQAGRRNLMPIQASVPR